MSSIHVAKSDTGWTVSKNGLSFALTDKNKNGNYDDGDLCKELSGSGNSIATDDLGEIKWQILQLGDGATPREIAEYNNYKEQKAAKEKRLQQQQQYQQPTQQPKKTGFWNTFGQIAGVVGRGAMGFMGMLLGFGGGANAWAFNSGSNNDWGVRTYGGLSGGLLAGSNSLAMGLGSGTMGMGGMGNNYGSQLQSIIEMQNQQNIQRQEEFTKWNENYKVAQEEKQAETKKKEAVSKADKLNDNENLCKYNQTAFEKIYDLDAEEYSEEDTALINKIDKFNNVPHNIIADNKEDTNKLSEKAAARLDALIKKYEKADNEVLKEKVMDKAKYEQLTKLLEKAQTQDLTKEDIEAIESIIKTPIDKKAE